MRPCRSRDPAASTLEPPPVASGSVDTVAASEGRVRSDWRVEGHSRGTFPLELQDENIFKYHDILFSLSVSQTDFEYELSAFVKLLTLCRD